MTYPCDYVIQSLENHPSRLNKEGILECQADEKNLELFEGFRLALDSLISFGVKKIPTHGGPDGQGLPWPAFLELAELLYTRQLTGHDARDAIELALSASTKSQWNNWYRRILLKDLKCGVSEKTINKVLKFHPSKIKGVPVFEVMLAHDGANHEKKITGKKLLEIKLDGVRVITIINMENRTVTQYSRNGKLLENFSHITKGLLDHIDDFDRSWVLDGEMVSSSFQALMKQVHRKSDVKATDAKLMLFDIIPLSEFKAGKSALGQKRRSALLRSMKPLFSKISTMTALQSSTMIDVIDQIEVDLDSYVGELLFNDFNKQTVLNGFEGIMIKDVDAKYVCKRNVAWLKQKPFIEVSLTIVGFEEGAVGTKNVGKLGAFIVEGEDDGKKIRGNVGGGFSDDQRQEYWDSRDSLLGQVCEVRADALTKNQDSVDMYNMRFARFLRFRGFKAGEKI